jgi:hypothetical protein
VSAASLLDVSESTDSKGKKYYRYQFLTRSGEYMLEREIALVLFVLTSVSVCSNVRCWALQWVDITLICKALLNP